MSASSRAVATTRDKIREARLARGWSQTRLAQEAGTSLRTITRIETTADYGDPRTLSRIEAALGIGEYATPDRAAELVVALEQAQRDADTRAKLDGPRLRRATADQLVEEILRRLHTADGAAASPRITSGEMPADVPTRPGVRHGARRAARPVEEAN